MSIATSLDELTIELREQRTESNDSLVEISDNTSIESWVKTFMSEMLEVMDIIGKVYIEGIALNLEKLIGEDPTQENIKESLEIIRESFKEVIVDGQEESKQGEDQTDILRRLDEHFGSMVELQEKAAGDAEIRKSRVKEEKIESGKPGFIGSFKEGFRETESPLEKLAKKLRAFAARAGMFVKMFLGLGAAIIAGFGVFKGIKAAIEDVAALDPDASIFEKILTAFMGLIKGAVSAILGGVIEFGLTIAEKVLRFFGANEAADWLKDLPDVRKLIENGMDIIRDFFLKLPENIKNLFQSVKETMSEKWNAIKGGFSDAISGIKESIQNMFADLLKPLITALPDFLMKKLPPGVLKFAGVNPETGEVTEEVQKEKADEEAVDEMKESGAFNKNMIGLSTIDAAKLKEHTADQLQSLLDAEGDDLSEADQLALKNRIKMKRQIEAVAAENAGPTTEETSQSERLSTLEAGSSARMEQAAELNQASQTNQQLKSEQSTSATIVAPTNNSQVSNTSVSNQAIHSGTASPVDTGDLFATQIAGR